MPRFSLVSEVYPFRGQDRTFPEISFTKSRQKNAQSCVIVKISLSMPMPTDTAHSSNSTYAHEHCPHQTVRQNDPGSRQHLPAAEYVCPNLKEKHTLKKEKKWHLGIASRVKADKEVSDRRLNEKSIIPFHQY